MAWRHLWHHVLPTLMDSVKGIDYRLGALGPVFLWLLLSAFPGHAEEPAATAPGVALAPMVVTARGTAVPISFTPGGVGVVTAAEIEEIQPESITDITRRIPGVEKASDSPWGAGINIRGLGRNSVVFLIDGCRVNTGTDINAQFGLVNPYDIARIEVLKGPISALYGSGSIGGVVNVITKKAQFAPAAGAKGEVITRYGDNPRGAGIYANAAVESPRYWAFASGSYRDHDDREGGHGEEVPNSQYRDEHARIGAALRWNDFNRTELDVQHVQGYDIGIPGKGLSLPEGPDATYPRVSRTLYAVTHTLESPGAVLTESQLKLYYQEIQRRVLLDAFPAGSPLQSLEPGADHQTVGLKWSNRFQWDDHAAVIGLDYGYWGIDNTERTRRFSSGLTGIDSSLGEVSQDTAGLFLEDDWQMSEHLALNAGGRVDYIESRSDDLYNWIIPPNPAITPALKREEQTRSDVSWQAHLGLTWRISEPWSATLIAASSYRAPDLMDRFKYINLGGGVELYGNPDLDPERSYFFEGGLHYGAAPLHVSAAAYANFLEDLITEEAIRPAVRRMANVDRAVIYGSELEVQWFLATGWELYGNVAYSKGRNRSDDESLPFIAPLNGCLGLRYQTAVDSGFWADAELDWAAAQHDVPDGTEEGQSWQTVNLRAGYRFESAGLHHEIVLAAENLLDEDYVNYLSTSRGVELKEPGRAFSCLWKVAF